MARVTLRTNWQKCTERERERHGVAPSEREANTTLTTATFHSRKETKEYARDKLGKMWAINEPRPNTLERSEGTFGRQSIDSRPQVRGRHHQHHHNHHQSETEKGKNMGIYGNRSEEMNEGRHREAGLPHVAPQTLEARETTLQRRHTTDGHTVRNNLRYLKSYPYKK